MRICSSVQYSGLLHCSSAGNDGVNTFGWRQRYRDDVGGECSGAAVVASIDSSDTFDHVSKLLASDKWESWGCRRRDETWAKGKRNSGAKKSASHKEQTGHSIRVDKKADNLKTHPRTKWIWNWLNINSIFVDITSWMQCICMNVCLVKTKKLYCVLLI